jgi:DNA ligase (NAD+)
MLNMKTRKELENLLTTYNDAYRIGKPLISDPEYNYLEDEYRKLYSDVEGQIFLSSLRNSPVDKKRKEKLPYKMTSLDKFKSVREIKEWVLRLGLKENIYVVITPKYDGISLLVNEKHCWTKGVVEEQMGQRSDSHFLKINLHQLSTPDTVIGEAIMKRSVFNKKYSKKVGGKYSHPRNMVAGLFNATEPGEELKDVNFIAYGYPRGINILHDKRETVQRMNIPYLHIAVEAITEEKLNHLYDLWKRDLDYDIDGLVIDLDWAIYRNSVPDRSSGNIGYAVAFKNPSWSGRAKTEVASIEVNISKQGKLKPVAILDPVDIDGVEVSRVNVTNMRTLYDLCMFPGSKIEVKRSGDVIPKIIGIHNQSVPQRDECLSEKEFKVKWDEMISDFRSDEVLTDRFKEYWKTFGICPSCECLTTKWDETKTEMICDSNICIGKLTAKAVYFFETIGIEEFGEPSIKQIMKHFSLLHPYNIIKLSVPDLLELDGWAETSANKLINQFNKLRIEGVPLARLLTALDLFNGKIAEKTCQMIFDNYDIKGLELRTKEDAIAELIKIKGVSNITAGVFKNGWEEWKRIEKHCSLYYSYIQTPKVQPKSNRMENESVCFTGFRNKEWEKMIQENGGSVVDGVSKKTTILVVKDLSSTPSKMKRAQELGTRVMSSVEFAGFIKEKLS